MNELPTPFLANGLATKVKVAHNGNRLVTVPWIA
jgi:hypothetical protein